METEANNEATTEATDVAKGAKSIIDPKYRLKYKTPDWLAQLLLDNTSKTKDVPARAASEQVGKIGEEGFKPAKTATEAKTINDGVDVDRLFALATENGLGARIEKFKAQAGGHGFEGRIRMTVRNMLQPVVKQRHGLVVDGAFVVAPEDFLRKIGVLEGVAPSHTANGEKIAKVVEAKTESEPAAAQEGSDPAPAPASKLKKKK